MKKGPGPILDPKPICHGLLRKPCQAAVIDWGIDWRSAPAFTLAMLTHAASMASSSEDDGLPPRSRSFVLCADTLTAELRAALTGRELNLTDKRLLISPISQIILISVSVARIEGPHIDQNPVACRLMVRHPALKIPCHVLEKPKRWRACGNLAIWLSG